MKLVRQPYSCVNCYHSRFKKLPSKHIMPTCSSRRPCLYRELQVGCQVANAKYSGYSCDRPIRWIELFV